MNKSNENYINEWFELSEDNLIGILIDKDSSKDQMFNAFLILDEKYGYSVEQLNEFLPALGAAAGALGRGIAKGALKSYAAAKGIGAAGSAVKNFAANTLFPKDTIRGNITKNILHQMGVEGKPIYNMDQLMSSPEKNRKREQDQDSWADMRKKLEQERKNNAPLRNKQSSEPSKPSTAGIPANESYNGEVKVLKTFTQFRNEIFEEQELYIEDLDNESLAYVIESEDFDDESKIYAVMELVERDIIEFDDEEINQIYEASFPLSGNSTSKALAKPTASSGLLSKLGKGVAGLSIAKTIRDIVRPQLQKKGLAPAEKDDEFNVLSQASRAAKKAASKPSKSLPNVADAFRANKKDEFNIMGRAARETKKALPNAPKSGTAWTSIGPNKSGGVGSKRAAIPTQKSSSGVAPKPVSPAKPTPSQSTVKPSGKPNVATKTPPTPARKALPSKSNISSPGNDLRQSVDRLRGAASAAATATNRAKTALAKIPGAGRMNQPTSRGGMSSAGIHQSIAKLGGEPVRSTPRSISAPKPSAVSGGAPTTAVGSKPPPLVRSTAKKM